MPIELRRRTYFAYLDVPKDVRQTLGRRVYRQTLKTDSKSVAKSRAAPIVASWKAEIARVRGGPRGNGDDSDAAFWRQALRRATSEAERETILDLIWDKAGDLGPPGGPGDPETGEYYNPEAGKFYAAAIGETVPTIEHLDEWIASLQVKTKTASQRRTNIERLAGKFSTLQDISRKEVRRWATELSAELKPASVQRLLGDCRRYWAYLQTIEVVSEDSAPFDKLGLKVKKDSWLPFDPADVVRLLDTAIADDDDKLADLIRLAMYSGARQGELCALRVEHVKDDHFRIADAKTAAGVRTVPIHDELKQTMARLIDESTDGFVLSELQADKNGARSGMLGKRFTRLKRRLGHGDRYVFHSLRGTVITMMEHAGVPEGTVQDIVGHERSTITGSTYSGKSTLAMRRDALAKLKYPTS